MNLGETKLRGLREVVAELPCSGVTLTLRVKPLPSGLQQRITREIPAPRPPSRQVQDRKGRPILLYDERDPEYLRQVEEALYLQMLALLRHALAEDTTITWDSPLDPAKPLRKLAEETRDELDKFEFPMADLIALVTTITREIGITTENVESAASDFSRSGTSSEPGSG